MTATFALLTVLVLAKGVAPDAGFEELLEQSGTAGVGLRQLKMSFGPCSGEDEGNEGQCLADAASARAALKAGSVLVYVTFSADQPQIRFGGYDVKRGGLPVELEQLAAMKSENVHWAQFCFDNDASGEEDELSYSTAGKVAWKGLLPVAGKEAANAIVTDPRAVTFEVILALRPPTKAARAIPGAQQIQAALLADLQRQANATRGVLSSDERALLNRNIACVKNYPTQRYDVTAVATVRGLRVFTQDGDDYLVSIPASIESLRARRERERAAVRAQAEGDERECETLDEALAKRNGSQVAVAAKACKALGFVLVEGKAMPRDVPRGQSLLSRTCSINPEGNADACDRVRALKQDAAMRTE